MRDNISEMRLTFCLVMFTAKYSAEPDGEFTQKGFFVQIIDGGKIA